jgi:hypothetical protein
MAVPYAYKPETGSGSGIDKIMKSPGLSAHMATIGSMGVQIAATYSPHPGLIHSAPVTAYKRWCVNVVNTSKDALSQEYATGYRGNKWMAPRAPLGHVLAYFWVRDPHRHMTNHQRAMAR